MLIHLLKALFARGQSKAAKDQARQKIDSLVSQAFALKESGKLEESVNVLRKVLELDPYHIEALNQIAVYLSDLQREDEAVNYFERATLIDDSFAPALINISTRFATNFQTARAEKYLKRAQEVVPDNPYVDTGFSSIYGVRGKAGKANFHQLQAWLKDFDNLPFAHNYLFYHGYPSSNSAEMTTAEHLFWAETLDERHLYPLPGGVELAGERGDASARKIRIGYLSADFRKHSVRFFFRPLLEHHDREQFEIYGYYDMAWEDEQTCAIRDRCDVFRDIANLPDGDVVKIIRNDKLDILVELTGHTSVTRIHLFGNRLARIQMSALGYPPTTGLRSIDYKVVDLQAAPVGAEHLYAEQLLRLPDSFWCFNPLEETPDPAPPPQVAQGNITFGCFGNILKISRRILDCWARIMNELADSQLIIKAIAFQDTTAKESVKELLDTAGIDLARVRLDLPDPPEKLYSAYAEVDIILDTCPYNGGTTSCFAFWMGVPVVTLTDKALPSRMGASMLHVLGLDDLIAASDDAYVKAAVGLANDRQRLARLRKQLREDMLATPLGNGALYARQFEDACIKALDNIDNRQEVYKPPSPQLILPEREIIRRVESVLRTKQAGAAQRILQYCLRHYPESVGGHILRASLFEHEGEFEKAHDYLTSALVTQASGEGKYAIMVNLLRVDLQLEKFASVKRKAAELVEANLDDFGKLHIELYRAAANAWSQLTDSRTERDENSVPSFISIIIHCNDDAQFAAMQDRLSSVMCAGMFETIHLHGESRCAEYEQAIDHARSEIVVLIRPEAVILSPDFHYELSEAMTCYDVVGFAGADRLAGTRWFDAGFPHGKGAAVLPSFEQPGKLSLNVYGPGRERFQGGLKVLDGALIAAKKTVLGQIDFDKNLVGDHGLCEMDWCFRAASANYSLCAAPRLGIFRQVAEDHHGGNWFECATYFRKKHDLPDTLHEGPVAGASVLLKSPDLAWPVIQHFYPK